MKKGILILLLAICLLFTISSVCASDVNDTAIKTSDEIQVIEETNDVDLVSSEDGEVITSSENEDVLSATTGTFTELQNKIRDAALGSTISLDKDYSYDSGFNTEGITINKDLTINGNGHTLNGLSKSRIFYITGSSCTKLTLNNIVFTNGHAIYNSDEHEWGDGGAICADNGYWGFYGDLLVSGCTFSNNIADNCGGAFSGYPGNFKNCKFTNNKANGKNNGGCAGALYLSTMTDSSKEFSLTNCIFTSNVVVGRGGAIFSEDTLHINSCTFNSNKATESGGAIYFKAYLEKLTIANSNFNSNQASKDGGAIFSLDYLTISNSNFNSNKATNGGAVCSAEYLSVTSSKFNNNKATEDGGAIYHDCYSRVNTQYSYYIENYDGLIKSSTFTNNVANGYGGAIYSNIYSSDNAKNEKIEKCTFQNNKANEDSSYNNVLGGTTKNCIFKAPTKTKLTLKKVKVKKSAKKLVLKATLKKGKNPLKGKKITFKFKGKKYKAKTNKKGIAKVTIKKKVLKKLKVGKKVKYQAIYGKLTVKRTAKVKK